MIWKCNPKAIYYRSNKKDKTFVERATCRLRTKNPHLAPALDYIHVPEMPPICHMVSSSFLAL